MQIGCSLAVIKSLPCTVQEIIWSEADSMQASNSGIKSKTVRQKHILAVRNKTLDLLIAVRMSVVFLAHNAFWSVSLCI